jgi:hypothetical protein
MWGISGIGAASERQARPDWSRTARTIREILVCGPKTLEEDTVLELHPFFSGSAPGLTTALHRPGCQFFLLHHRPALIVVGIGVVTTPFPFHSMAGALSDSPTAE